MRFLEFVSCGRKASRRPDKAPHRLTAEAVVIPANLPPRSSTAMVAAAPSHAKVGRGSISPTDSGTASQWRPTLGGISEEVVVNVKVATEEKGSRPRQAGKAKAALSERTRSRYYTDDYQHFTAPAVLPTFAPTAFLF